QCICAEVKNSGQSGLRRFRYVGRFLAAGSGELERVRTSHASSWRLRRQDPPGAGRHQPAAARARLCNHGRRGNQELTRGLMHPILARVSRLALYLAVWTLVGLLLARLPPWPGGRGAARATVVAVPLALAYAFFCLSAWYVSRSSPLGSTGALRLSATTLTSSIISSALWLVVARGWVDLFARRGEQGPS